MSNPPYRVEEQAGAWGKVYVYDPNFPGDGNRYFYFDFTSSSHSFSYDMGSPIPRGGSTNYRVRSGDGWLILLTPISEYAAYDSRVLHDGIIGWLFGAGEIVHSNEMGQQLGYSQGAFVATIPGSAPMFQWFAPTNDPEGVGFSLPAGEYQATISGTTHYEYLASSITTTLAVQVQELGSGREATAAQPNDLDRIQINTQSISATYSAASSSDRSVSFQLAGGDRQYGILNGTVTATGTLQAEVLSHSLYLTTSGMTSTFDLEVRGPDGDTLGWFLHAGITMPTNAAMTIEAPSIEISSLVTISVASSPGGPIEQIWVLDNQVKRVFLPLLRFG